MNSAYSEQATQTVGKIRFIVTSNYKDAGHSVQDKLSNLLAREAQINRLDNVEQARYNEPASTV